MKIFTLAPREKWIIDRFKNEWDADNSDIASSDPREADVIWIMAEFCWNHLPPSFLETKKVLTTIHHIVPNKFGVNEQKEFVERDNITTEYHVPNKHTHDFIRPLTSKKITVIPYWANGFIWRRTSDDVVSLREKYEIPRNSYVISSFQRDTEGASILQGKFLPKLEKGGDLFCDYVENLQKKHNNMHVVLAGWRRQYVMERLKTSHVPFSYFELPSQQVLNELYQLTDLYPVASRVEGGPQALIECGLLGVPCISRDVGIASVVLPPRSINYNLNHAEPSVPDVETLKLPHGYEPYRKLLMEM